MHGFLSFLTTTIRPSLFLYIFHIIMTDDTVIFCCCKQILQDEFNRSIMGNDIAWQAIEGGFSH
jgi:hypothetical protein